MFRPTKLRPPFGHVHRWRSRGTCVLAWGCGRREMWMHTIEDPQGRGLRRRVVRALDADHSPEEPDDELLGWLRESYQQMGLQERLAER